MTPKRILVAQDGSKDGDEVSHAPCSVLVVRQR